MMGDFFGEVSSGLEVALTCEGVNYKNVRVVEDETTVFLSSMTTH
jgi:hypothetical protein